MKIGRVFKFILTHPLTKRDVFSAVLRFIRYQIASRFHGGTMVYEWVKGLRFYVRRGETALTGNIYAGLYEFSDMGFLLHFLRKGDVFADVGANVGSYTLLAGSCGATGFAFEPIPETNARLVENLRLNHLDGRFFCPVIGIGSSQSTLHFTSDNNCENHALTPNERTDRAIRVSVQPLDVILNGASPTLIKIDVEGLEMEVLKGATKTLENHALKAVIIELNGNSQRYGYEEQDIVTLMVEKGFLPYAYDPLEREVKKLSGQNPLSDNTLFIRDPEFVFERVMTAGRVQVNDLEV